MRPDPTGRVRVLPTDKGLPPWAAGLTAGELAQRHPDVRSGGFLFPLLTADESALAGNIAAMAGYARDHDVLLCPHGKTTMSPELVRRQLDAGAWGITAATISQVRTFRAFAVGRILLANELVDPAGLDWVLSELDRDPGFELLLYVDSPAGLAAVGAALERRGLGRPVSLLVELGAPGGRTGCRTVDEAVELARGVLRLPGARLAGVAGYEGVLGHTVHPATVAMIGGYLGAVREVLDAVVALGSGDSAGLGGAGERGELVVSAGGSTWFDLVLDELGPVATGGRARLVLRSGCYVTHDHGLYAATTPATRAAGPALAPALRLWAQVLSVPEPGRAIVGFGRRDCSFDAGLPVPLERLTGDGQREPLDAVRVVDLNDQHAFLEHDDRLAVGDLLSFGISHPCTTFDKWRLIPVLDDDEAVVDLLSTWF